MTARVKKKKKNSRKEEAATKGTKGKKADGKASKTRSRSHKSRSDRNKDRHAKGYWRKCHRWQCDKPEIHRACRRALFRAIEQVMPDLDDRVRRLVMWMVLKEHYGMSFRQLATHFAEYAMDRRMCGLKPSTNPDRPYPSKSTPQARGPQSWPS